MSVIVLATVAPRPGHHSEVVEALKMLAVEAHDKAGVERFALLDAGEEILIYEQWANQEAWHSHAHGALPERVRHVLETKLLGAPVHRYLTPIAAGEEKIGTL